MTQTDTQALLASHALRLFLEHGYEGTSLSDLMKASGLSKGAVYHYFRSKEELFEAAIEQFFLRFLPGEQSGIEAEKGLRACVMAMVEGYCGMLAAVAEATPDRLAYFRFLIAITPKITPQLQERLALARQQIVEAATREQEARQLTRVIEAEDIADQCLALIEGTGFLATISAEPGDEEQALRRIVGRYLDGLYR